MPQPAMSWHAMSPSCHATNLTCYSGGIVGWWHSGLMAYWVALNQTQCNPQPLSERCPTNLHGLDQGDVSGFQSVEGGDSSLQSRNGFSKVTFTLILDGLGCSCCLVSHCLVSSNHLHNQSPDEDCSKHYLHSHLMKTAATPPTQSPDEECSKHHLHIPSPDEDCSKHHLHSHLMKNAANTTYTVTWWRLQQTPPTQSPDEECSKHHLHNTSPDEDCSNTTCTISHLVKTAATPPAQSVTWWRLQQHHLHNQSPGEDCSNTTCTISHLVKTAATPPAQSVTWWRLQQHHLHNQSPGEDCSNTTCTISHLVKIAATPPAQSVTWWRLVKTLPTSPNFKLFSDSAWSNFELRCLCKIRNKNKQIPTNPPPQSQQQQQQKTPSPQPTPSTEAAAVQVQLTSFLASTSTVSCSIFTISFSVSSEVLISSGCRSVSSCCMTETWEAAKSSFSSPTR